MTPLPTSSLRFQLKQTGVNPFGISREVAPRVLSISPGLTREVLAS